MSQIHQCRILDISQLNEWYCLLKIAAPQIAEQALPGQFVNVKIAQQMSDDPLLNRPFSLHQVDRHAGVIQLLIKVVGRGTQLLSQRSEDTIEMIGPLGQGFRVQNSGNALLVAGGIGLAPLKELANQLAKAGVQLRLLLGLTEEKDLVLASLVKELSPEIVITHPEKSSYPKGLVTDLVKKAITETDYDQIYACGPKPMLQVLQIVLGQRLKDAQFSLEEQMGCGVGLCFSCVSKIKVNQKNSREKTADWSYERICSCGPVFFADEVIF